jgi:hypothetical protein
VHTWQRQVDRAIAQARRAVSVDSNFADGYVTLGIAETTLANPPSRLSNSSGRSG